MNFFNRLSLLLAVSTGAALAVMFASQSRRRRQHAVNELQHKAHIGTWESEGGNLTPPPATAIHPAIQPAV